jgi:hypothetical protein
VRGSVVRKVLQLASSLALTGIVIPPVLYFGGELARDVMETVMLVATVLWFAATPFWMNDRSRA